VHPGRRALIAAAALGVALAGTACKGEHHVATFPATTTTTTAPRIVTEAITPGIPAPTPYALAAVAKGTSVTVHPAPGSPDVVMKLANPTIEMQPLAMFVADRQGDWLNVRLPVRPNGTTGWIEASQVDLQPVDSRIVVSVSQRNLRVLDKSQRVVYETNVAVGKPSTPTPLGRFFIDVWMPNPGRPYGTFLLSIGGFSDVLKSFGGGRGQIAMHGWADPSVMGKNVSNGCVRMRNDDIAKVAEMAPLGTPVEIVA
jgi:lipoprotein-anchoring transpeptidase ErfK/SrfK